MSVSRQTRRAMERKRKKEERAAAKKQEMERKRIAKKLNLSDYEYRADDSNLTLSAMAPELVDFLIAFGLAFVFDEYVKINKRKSKYTSAWLSVLFVLQNILGYDRVETTRALNQDRVLLDKLGLDQYPDPETFRDELARYTDENIEQLFQVNQKLLWALCQLVDPQYIDLHFDGKVITVYGDQEEATVGYNPAKPGRKSYHLKVCTIEPFGFILAIHLQPGNAVSETEFTDFYKKCVAAVPQNHLTIRTVRVDSGFFSDPTIKAFEGDYHFFEVVAKKYPGLKKWIESLPEEDFEAFYPDETIFGAAFSFRFESWSEPRDFVVVRKLLKHENNGQGMLFPKWRYQVICHNQPDLSPKEVWKDYNKRAKIELNIRDLDYDHFITKVPTGQFLSNLAYFWHSTFAYNMMLIFRNHLLPKKWSTARTSTLRKLLICIPGRLVNHSGQKIMRLMEGFPYADVLNYVKERIIWLYQKLHPLPT
jgi:hypothetical protein